MKEYANLMKQIETRTKEITTFTTCFHSKLFNTNFCFNDNCKCECHKDADKTNALLNTVNSEFN